MNRKDFIRNSILCTLGVSLLPMNSLGFRQFYCPFQYIELPKAIVHKMHGNLYDKIASVNLPIISSSIKYNRSVYCSPSSESQDIHALEFISDELSLKIISSKKGLIINGDPFELNHEHFVQIGTNIQMKAIEVNSNESRNFLSEKEAVIISLNGLSTANNREIGLNKALIINSNQEVNFRSDEKDNILVFQSV